MEVRRAQLTVVAQLLDETKELVGEAREAATHVIGSAPAPRHRDMDRPQLRSRFHAYHLKII